MGQRTADPFNYDQKLREDGLIPLAGLDEAGRGPLAGPVVASAVILSPGGTIEGLKDSKKLNQKQRSDLFWDILCSAEDIGIGIVDSDEIDRINILRATRKAMTMAVKELGSLPQLLIIDAVTLPLQVKQISFPKAEDISASVAAASIVAKVTRDRLMDHYHQLYPVYGFHKHKGYGTREHLEKLHIHGPCPIHRRSFSPISSPSLPF
jgi:ribonuclease HII